MASRLDSGVVYAAGAVQGIVLVTFPAASTIFTSPTEYGLSSTQYGTLFLPQVVLAIAASLGGAWLGRSIGLKPVYLAGLTSGLIAVSLRLPLRSPTTAAASRQRGSLPARFWVYAVFAVLYGICETLNGNWAQLDMTGSHGASTELAALALTLFWAMVTLGRVFVALAHRVSPEWTYHVLPFALAAVFLLIGFLPDNSELPAVYRWASVIAVAMGVVSFAVRRRDSARP